MNICLEVVREEEEKEVVERRIERRIMKMEMVC